MQTNDWNKRINLINKKLNQFQYQVWDWRISSRKPNSLVPTGSQMLRSSCLRKTASPKIDSLRLLNLGHWSDTSLMSWAKFDLSSSKFSSSLLLWAGERVSFSPNSSTRSEMSSLAHDVSMLQMSCPPNVMSNSSRWSAKIPFRAGMSLIILRPLTTLTLPKVFTFGNAARRKGTISCFGWKLSELSLRHWRDFAIRLMTGGKKDSR